MATGLMDIVKETKDLKNLTLGASWITPPSNKYCIFLKVKEFLGTPAKVDFSISLPSLSRYL